METIHLESLDELQGVFESIAGDFAEIEWTPALQEELDYLAEAHAAYFANTTGPDDSQWPPLAPSTVQRKGHDKILIDTRRLHRSLTDKSHSSTGDAVREVVDEPAGTALKFGTFVPYSPLHDKPSGNRPARRHVGMNERQLDDAAERIADFALEALEHAGD